MVYRAVSAGVEARMAMVVLREHSNEREWARSSEAKACCCCMENRLLYVLATLLTLLAVDAGSGRFNRQLWAMCDRRPASAYADASAEDAEEYRKTESSRKTSGAYCFPV